MSVPQPDLPPLPSLPEATLDRALTLVERLRAGCPWDAAQTPRSLRRHLLEEAHEVVGAIDGGDPSALREELGDLLLNLAFQIVIAEENGDFTRGEVVRGLDEKMARRHPHLEGGGPARSWEVLKADERRTLAGSMQPRGLLDDLAPDADPLTRAHRIQARAADVGFDWPDPEGAWRKVREEVEEVGVELTSGDERALEEELGDLLFSVVNLSRLAGTAAPLALARANEKFIGRFRVVEALAREADVDIDTAGLEVLDGLWERAKRGER